MFSASKTKQAVSGAYTLTKSLRFRSSATGYLSRTMSSSSTTFTMSAWVKRGSLATYQYIFASGPNTAANDCGIAFNQTPQTPDTIYVYNGSGQVASTAVYRDTSAWYHVVLSVSSGTATVYVNNINVGITQTGVSLGTYGRIGGYNSTYNNPFDGYMADFYLIDGQAKTPSSFGATSSTTGVWQPIAYTGTYGTAGFHLTFTNTTSTTTLGYDTSGNSNNWTTNNISLTTGSTYDSMNDVPTLTSATASNYAVLNPNDMGASSTAPSNANLTFTNGNSGLQITRGTIAPTSGKWYFEATYTTLPAAGSVYIGVKSIVNNTLTTSNGLGSNSGTTNEFGYAQTGYIQNNGTASNFGTALTTGDVLMVAFDLGAGYIWWGKNGTWLQGSPASGTSPMYSTLTASGGYAPAVANNAAYTSQVDFNFGQQGFKYTPPSGYNAVNTYNLPTPTIGATSATQAGKFFNPVLYTGNSGVNVVSGMGFQPDMLWQRDRTSTGNNVIDDAVRGINKVLITNLTLDEITGTTYLTSFDSDGFSMNTASPAFNLTGRSYVAWGWKANGSGSTNTAGSITSTVSANTTAGFSVLTYTGTGSLATVGHGLGVAPSMIIIKRRNAAGNDWAVYHISTGANGGLALNDLRVYVADSAWFNNTAPTSSVFTINTSSIANASGGTYVAYCFAPIAGFSAFGSYVGNGSATGPFVYFGFKPKFIMVKSSSRITDWNITDGTRNPTDSINYSVNADTTGTETTFTLYNYLSNGFQIITSDVSVNSSGETYIYMAFASNPFKYSNAY